MRWIIPLLMTGIVSVAVGQKDPLISSYKYNLYYNNPAAAGSFFDLEGTAQVRTPFNVTGPPFISNLSFYTNADELHGAIGANIFYYYLGDHAGEQNVSTRISYNYRFTINDYDIRLGGSGGILTKGTRINNAVTFPGQNPNVYQTRFITDAGIFINNQRTWVGFSVTNINEPFFVEAQYNQLRTIYGTAGITLRQGKIWEFTPSTMVRTNREEQTLDINLGIRYITKFVGGVGFRRNLSSSAGSITENWGLFRVGYEDHGFRVVYSIDRPVSVLQGTFSIHEFTISVMLRKSDDPYVQDFLEE